jgi:hypothetical protein
MSAVRKRVIDLRWVFGFKEIPSLLASLAAGEAILTAKRSQISAEEINASAIAEASTL